jgi:YqaJ-like viral recombinase domain
MKLVVCDQGSEAWLAARAGACTASRFGDARSRVGGLSDQQRIYVNALRAGYNEGKALELADYKKRPTFSKFDRALKGERVDEPSDAAIRYAWLLAHERVAGQPLDDTFTTYAMRRGIELEPYARQAYEARYGVMVEQGGVALTEDGLFGYSTDGSVEGQNGGVEIKCPLAADKLGSIWQHPETAEAEYVEQIDGGMWLTGWDWIDLIVYCPWLQPVGKELFVKRIWRDDERIEALEADLLDFNTMRSSFEQVLRAERPTRYESARSKPAARDVALRSITLATTRDAPAALPASIF